MEFHIDAIAQEGRLAMPLLLQICLATVTVAIVAIAVTSIRAVIRLGEAAERLTSAAQVSMTQVERVVQETHELLESMREIMPRAKHVVNRFQGLGERAADLSTAIFNEIEQPALTAVAMARGVKTGMAEMLGLLTRRFGQRNSSHNGDQDHE
jgi:uncharacterized protein YoxC